MTALFTVALAGCTVGPNFVRPIPQTPAHWSRPAATPRPIDNPPESTTTEETADLRRWWADFNDPTLSSLIERSMTSNLDLHAAVLRIEEARAQRGVTAASLWPTLSTNVSYSSTRISETTATGLLFTGTPGINFPNPYNQYQLGADVSWEVDLFGRVRRSVEVADAYSGIGGRSPHWSVSRVLPMWRRSYTSSFAAHSCGFELPQGEHRDHRGTARPDAEASCGGTHQRCRRGDATAEMTATRAELPSFDFRITQNINQLSKLLLANPRRCASSYSADARTRTSVPRDVSIGLPVELARRRPDIREAEASWHAATAQNRRRGGGALSPPYAHGQWGAFNPKRTKLLSGPVALARSDPPSSCPCLTLAAGRRCKPVQDVRAKESAVAYQRRCSTPCTKSRTRRRVSRGPGAARLARCDGGSRIVMH
jgi:hypothetical protein